MVVVPFVVVMPVMTGKFWSWFGPVSASPRSLDVGPSPLRSIPTVEVLLSIRFDRIRLCFD